MDDFQPVRNPQKSAPSSDALDTGHDETLGTLTAQIESAFEAGDYAHVAQLFEHDMLAVWFGLKPDRLQQMIRNLVRHPEGRTPMVIGLDLFLNQHDQSGTAMRTLLRQFDRDSSTQGMAIHIVAALEPRFRGRPVEALTRALRIRRNAAPLQLLFDAYGGWPLMTSVQLGVTAMLAGEFTHALRFLAEAQLRAYPTRFSFLVRDALVRSALVHAAYGSRAEAGRLLARSERVVRTHSWAEQTIDASRDIAFALIADEPFPDRLERLRDVDPGAVGELWPFYLVAMQRLLLANGGRDEAEELLEAYESMPLPRVEGQGFSGSVLPLLRARMAIANRRPHDAEKQISRADPELTVTKVLHAQVQMHCGRHFRAVELAGRVRAGGGRKSQLELVRLTVLANSNHALRNEAASMEALEQIGDLQMPLLPQDAQLLHPELWPLAARTINGWPADGLEDAGDGVLELPQQLTPGEIAVLRELAKGSSRTAIAATLFISLNTVKSQLRTAYRKLGVNTAQAAVRAAERLGYL